MSPSEKITAFARTAIFCRDIDKSLALYRDLLGLTIVDDKTLAGPAIGRMVGLETCRLRIVHLRAGEYDGSLNGLYSVTEAELPQTQPPTKGQLHLGQTAIVLHSDDAAVLAERLAVAGYYFLAQPKAYETHAGGPTGMPGTITEMIFYDPDGVLVSVMGFRPNAMSV